jgi:hypothetical protein
VTTNLVNGSGVALTRRLREDGRDLAIIMLSSRTCPADHAEVMVAGCDAFLSKPCAPETLAPARKPHAGPAACSRRGYYFLSNATAGGSGGSLPDLRCVRRRVPARQGLRSGEQCWYAASSERELERVQASLSSCEVDMPDSTASIAGNGGTERHDGGCERPRSAAAQTHLRSR